MRELLAEKPTLLAEIQSLVHQPGSEATRRRADELARAIGALRINTEQAEDGTSVVVCFARWGGAGETYEERMQWFPPLHADRIRKGERGQGEGCEELSGGWYWIHW